MQVTIKQDRQHISRDVPMVHHADDTQFLINMFALHNTHLLRKVLGRRLTAPLPGHGSDGCEAFHASPIPQLQATRAKRWVETADKHAATILAKKGRPVQQTISGAGGQACGDEAERGDAETSQAGVQSSEDNRMSH